MEGYTLLRTTEDVVITNCTMADSIFACIGIGSETSGGIRNVRIEHCNSRTPRPSPSISRAAPAAARSLRTSWRTIWTPPI